ncbi:hypothetical protein A2U01_0089552, partial [Trifolium medium]|nr:hypothetical protein [Trifolium medium]
MVSSYGTLKDSMLKFLAVCSMTPATLFFRM